MPVTLDRDLLGSLSKLSLFENSERFHLIVNEGAKSQDVFFILGKQSGDDGEDDAGRVITSVYTDELKTSSDPSSGSTTKAPTMRLSQGFGYD